MRSILLSLVFVAGCGAVEERAAERAHPPGAPGAGSSPPSSQVDEAPVTLDDEAILLGFSSAGDHVAWIRRVEGATRGGDGELSVRDLRAGSAGATVRLARGSLLDFVGDESTALSDDGEVMTFQSPRGSGSLSVAATSGAAPARLLGSSARRDGAVFWPRRKTLLWVEDAAGETRVHLFETASGTDIEVARLPGKTALSLHFSPDARRLLIDGSGPSVVYDIVESRAWTFAGLAHGWWVDASHIASAVCEGFPTDGFVIFGLDGSRSTIAAGRRSLAQPDCGQGHSATGKLATVATEDGRLELFDLVSHVRQEISVNPEGVRGTARIAHFADDDRFFAASFSAYEDNATRWFFVNTATLESASSDSGVGADDATPWIFAGGRFASKRAAGGGRSIVDLSSNAGLGGPVGTIDVDGAMPGTTFDGGRHLLVGDTTGALHHFLVGAGEVGVATPARRLVGPLLPTPDGGLVLVSTTNGELFALAASLPARDLERVWPDVAPSPSFAVLGLSNHYVAYTVVQTRSPTWRRIEVRRLAR